MNREQAQLEAALAQGLQADNTPDLLGGALRRMADSVESGMVSVMHSRLDEARRTLTAVLSQGEALGKPSLQMGAPDNLSIVAADLGRGARWRPGPTAGALAGAIASRAEVAMGSCSSSRGSSPRRNRLTMRLTIP